MVRLFYVGIAWICLQTFLVEVPPYLRGAPNVPVYSCFARVPVTFACPRELCL